MTTNNRYSMQMSVPPDTVEYHMCLLVRYILLQGMPQAPKRGCRGVIQYSFGVK